jgi:nucleotide-binding universal stress UspA family protein
MTTPTAANAERLATTYAQVLMPVDFSRLSWRALPLADALARRFAVPRRILHVDTSSPWLDEGSSSLVLKATPLGHQVDVEVVAARSAAEGITRTLGDDESSLLVMSTHGHTGAGELVMGSTTEGVLREWSGAFVAAGPHFEAPGRSFSRIMLAVEPSMAPPMRLVEDVRAWAIALQVPVDLVSVTSPAMAADATEGAMIDEAQRAVAAVISFDDAVPVGFRQIESGREAHALVAAADERPGTILALATHARSAGARVLLGSVAMASLRHAKSSVLLRRYDNSERKR